MRPTRRWRRNLAAAVVLVTVVGATAAYTLDDPRRLAFAAADWIVGRWQAISDQRTERSTPEAAAPAVKVKVAVARKEDVPIFLISIGNVQAYNTVSVQSRVDGEITKILFQEGQYVKEGDDLAIIDPRPLKALLDQQQAVQQKDEALLAGALLDLERYETLSKSVVAVTRQLLEQQRSLVEQYKAQIKNDQAMVEYARTQLTYTSIRAPLSGRIGIRQVDQGNYVRANTPSTIAVINQLQPISVIFTVSAAALAQTKFVPGQTSAPVTTLDQDNVTEIDHGTIDLVDNQVDSATGTIKLKASFPNTAQKLWPGNFVNGRITLEVRRDAVTIPSAAVRHGPQGDFVWVARSDRTAGFRSVNVAQTYNDRALINHGLARGEEVVVEGYFRLETGAKIDIEEPSAPAKTPAAKKQASSAAERG